MYGFMSAATSYESKNMARAKGLIYSSLIQIIVLVLVVSVNSRKALVILTEENWDKMLDGEWMVEFYAPWCPACKALQPVWEDFSTWSSDLGITIGKVDVTTSPGLSGRFMVTALPTIYHVSNGTFRQYRGGRDKDSLISFIEEKKWEEIEPVPSWKSPGSVPMSVLASFFKLSTVLRSLHNQMVEEYGLPVWGSYFVFAVATILVGALLGLLLVCVIDCIYPPKAARPLVVVPGENDEGDEEDDLVDEGAESGPESQPEDSQAETWSENDDSQREDGDSQEEVEEERGAGDEAAGVRRRKP